MGDLLLTPVLYLTRATEPAVFPIIVRYAECFLISEAPEEEQDLKSFEANFFNGLWDEASDEKNNHKLDFPFLICYDWWLFSSNVSMRFQLHWGK